MQKVFYVESYGEVSRTQNPYFEFVGLKLFEGTSPVPAEGDRTYLSKFKFDATRFIWAELEIRNLQPDIEWTGEFFFNIYNDLNVLVAQDVCTEIVSTLDKNNLYKIFSKQGNETNVTWPKDFYTLEIVFMETLIDYCRCGILCGVKINHETNRTRNRKRGINIVRFSAAP